MERHRRGPPNGVEVTHGVNRAIFPVAGESVQTVKQNLEALYGIPYFAEAFVNGESVKVSHVLCAGDSLEFVKIFGYKAGKGKPRATAETEGLVRAYPALVQIAEDVKKTDQTSDDKIDEMTKQVAKWVEQTFGTLIGMGIPKLNEIVTTASQLRDQLARMDNASAYKKLGRPNSTAELAVFRRAMKRKGMTDKEICAEWKRRHPNDQQAAELTVDKLRGAYRRAYNDKDKKKPAS